MKALAVVATAVFCMSMLSPGAQVAWAQKAPDKVAPPETVSPARPDIPLPQLEDQWYCWWCGTLNPYPKQHYKDPMHRPMLAPGAKQMGKTRPEKSAPRHNVRFVGAERVLRHSKDLALTDAQISRLEDLAYKTRIKLIELDARLRKEQLVLDRLIQTDDNMVRINRQLDAVARKKVAVQSERLNNWFDARKVLTDAQKGKLSESFHWRGVAE